MADYAHGAYVQRNPAAVGGGTGDLPGTTDLAICVCGLRPPDENGNTWTAMTPAVARDLYDTLTVMKHLWTETNE